MSKVRHWRTSPASNVLGWRGILVALAALPGLALGASQTRTAAFEYDTNGLLIKEIVEPGDSNLCLVTTYTYDAYGNKTGSTTRNCNGSAGSHPGVNSEAAAPSGTAAFVARSVTTTYDAKGQYPVKVTNALAQAETRVFDSRFGQMTSLTGPNGLTTAWEYDGFGRKTKETRADGTVSTWSYALCAGCGGLSNTAYTITATATGAPSSVTYYDSLGRVIRTQTTGFDGSTLIYQDTVYDNLGRVAQKSLPYYSGQTVYWTRFTYDALGRVVQETAPDGSKTTIAYNGLTVRTTNDLGQTQVKTTNTQGQLASVTDPKGNKLTYGYDPLGNLLTTTDPNGNVSRLTYDLRGRKTAMADPDMGNWQYRYNALGELVGQTDAKGQVSSLSYDKLGRLVQRNEPDLVSNWYYDKNADGSACGKGVGKLCEAKSDNGYRRKTTYDGYGRFSQESTTLDIAYATAVTYDTAGRVATRNWPTGFSVKYVYTTLGFLKEVRQNDSGNALLWQANTYDAPGHLLTQTYGNNVVTQRTYQPTTGRLTGILAGAGNGVQNLVYTYDTLGNLSSRQDKAAGSQESFTYDTLNRLVTYSLQGGSVSGISTKTVAYDALGNITAKSDAGSYYYAPNTAPHAVTNVTNGPEKAWFHTYDANGNLIYTAINTLATGQTVARFEDYTSFNMPKQLRQGAAGQAASVTLDFVYGPEHQRTKQTSSVLGTTYYLNGTDGQGLLYEREIKPNGLVEHKHYIMALGSMVALHTTRSDNTKSLRYFHHDHLGSTSVITNESGAVVERLAYDPWGKRLYANGGTPPAGYLPQTTDRGFTMHEHLDEMGIIHMNGRIYDPVLGRFMSADPYIQAPGNLMSYNRYAYCFGNPLVCTDPSGYFSLSKAWKKVWRSTVGRIIVTVAVGYFVGPYVGGLYESYAANAVLNGGTAFTIGGSISTTSALIAGASGGFAAGLVGSGGNVEAGLKGAVSGLLFSGAGQVGGEGWDFTRIGAHAIAGCASGEISGGNCGTGALAAVAGKVTTIATGGTSITSAILAGGVASRVAGGSFANGAVTAAFGYLFNQMSKTRCFGLACVIVLNSGASSNGSQPLTGTDIDHALAGNRGSNDEGPMYGPYHRLEGGRPEVVTAIVASGELWGGPSRNTYASDLASVKAYSGPLPEGKAGVEFYTNVAPTSGSHPLQPRWYGGTVGVTATPLPDYVRIPIRVTNYRFSDQ